MKVILTSFPEENCDLFIHKSVKTARFFVSAFPRVCIMLWVFFFYASNVRALCIINHGFSFRGSLIGARAGINVLIGAFLPFLCVCFVGL